jgi:hypothetical protein
MREYQAMALELRPNCEFCDKDVPPASDRLTDVPPTER